MPRRTSRRERMGRIGPWLNVSENSRAPKYMGKLGNSRDRVQASSTAEQQWQRDRVGGRDSFFQPSKLMQMQYGKCWHCGKWRNEKDLVGNYCNDRAVKAPLKWAILLWSYGSKAMRFRTNRSVI